MSSSLRRRRHHGAALRTGLLVIVGAMLMAACGGGSDTAAESGDAAADSTATGESADPAQAGFVGTVDGTDAFIGIIVADSNTDADEALVYVCNGDEGIREWFKGNVDDPTKFTMTNEGGGSVSAEFVDDIWSGNVTFADGSTHQFTTELALGDAEGGAGIYEVDDPDAQAEGIWAAWVVDNDGNERGAWWQNSSFMRTQSRSSTRFALAKFVGSNGVLEMNGIVISGSNT